MSHVGFTSRCIAASAGHLSDRLAGCYAASRAFCDRATLSEWATSPNSHIFFTGNPFFDLSNSIHEPHNMLV